MMPTTFPEHNSVLNKPSSMTDEECGSLPVFKGISSDGYPVIISKWKPSKEDIEAINNGEGIYLAITGRGMPPISVFTENPFN